MKSLIFLTCVLFLFALSVNAQTTTQSVKPVMPAQPAPSTTVKPVTPVKRTPRTNNIDNKINNANNSLNSANNSVNNASATTSNAVNVATNTKNQAKTLSDQVGELVGKNKKPGDSKVNTTIVNVAGANFAKLRKLNEGILGCSAVQDAKMKFNAAQSIITITHTGSTSDLLKQIQKKSDLVTDDSITDLDDGKISLTLK